MSIKEPFAFRRLARHSTGTLALGVLAAIYNVPANAQLEEIVVSARRVEESLQDVPISVVAYSGEELEFRGLERGEDLMNAVPNVVIAGGGLSQSSSDITIRGMPNVGIYLDGVAQSSTGLLQQSLIELERMEILRGPQGTTFGRNSNGGVIQLISKRPGEEFGARVKAEVGEFSRTDLSASIDLPLSETLLSKLTVGSFTQDGQVCSLTVPACYGGKNDELLRADFLWTPSENFDLRIAYDYQRTESSDRKAVVFTNPNHQRIIGLNIAAYGLSQGAFSPETTALIQEFLPITEYTPRTHEPGFPGGQVGKWQTKGDGPKDGITTDFDQLTITASWDINDSITLESITAYWEKDGRNYRDIRGAEVIEAVEDDQYTRDNAFSQEFHLSGTAWEDRVTWLAGLWYQEYDDWGVNYRWATPWARNLTGPCRNGIITEVRDYIRDPANWDVGHTNYNLDPVWTDPSAGGNYGGNWSPTSGGVVPPSANCDADILREKSTDTALFGEVNIALNDQWNLGLGVRWSDREATDYRYDRDDVLVPGTALKPDRPGPIVGDIWAGSEISRTDEPDTSVWFTPKVSLDYQWTDDLMLFASYSEGFTAAEIQQSAIIGAVEIDPETVETVEFGIHSDWADGRLRFNASIFFTDWVNIRTSVNPRDPGTGIALPGTITVTGGNAEASGIDAELTWRPNDDFLLNAAVGFLDTKYKSLGEGVPIADGQRFPYAPDYSYNLGGTYTWDLPDGASLSLRGDYRYMDDYVTHPRDTAQVLQQGFGISSARLTYEASSGEWSAYIWGSNLGDVRYWNSGFVGAEGGLFLAQVGAPQEFGAGLTFTFD